MAFVKCYGCKIQIDIPDELAGNMLGEIKTIEPYYCDACERIALSAMDIDVTEECPYCGKDFEDFSDAGCAHCDPFKPSTYHHIVYGWSEEH